MSTLELFKSWTDEEKKQGLKSMPLFRRVELAKALIAAGWTPSDLRAAGWTPSDLIAAGWTPSALRAAGWTPSALRAAGWTPSDLRAAGWTPSALIAAGWTLSALRAAGWTPSDLEKISESFEADIKAKAKKMGAEESAFIIETLNRGLMNGSDYGTLDSCGCFLGTAAKKAGKSVDEYCRLHKIKKDGSSPAEQWFMVVRVGDTPENNFAAEMGVKWISEAIAQ